MEPAPGTGQERKRHGQNEHKGQETETKADKHYSDQLDCNEEPQLIRIEESDAGPYEDGKREGGKRLGHDEPLGHELQRLDRAQKRETESDPVGCAEVAEEDDTYNHARHGGDECLHDKDRQERVTSQHERP